MPPEQRDGTERWPAKFCHPRLRARYTANTELWRTLPNGLEIFRRINGQHALYMAWDGDLEVARWSEYRGTGGAGPGGHICGNYSRGHCAYSDWLAAVTAYQPGEPSPVTPEPDPAPTVVGDQLHLDTTEAAA